jgi:hypothetical protein
MVSKTRKFLPNPLLQFVGEGIGYRTLGEGYLEPSQSRGALNQSLKSSCAIFGEVLGGAKFSRARRHKSIGLQILSYFYSYT